MEGTVTDTVGRRGGTKVEAVLNRSAFLSASLWRSDDTTLFAANANDGVSGDVSDNNNNSSGGAGPTAPYDRSHRRGRKEAIVSY
mmetsp:Transcript_36404/g.116673  ORF Transcript_36404/g.116673 Transcript_36404/m.116673 type:complete len:85 (+) Transcript_36404:497-751(+)